MDFDTNEYPNIFVSIKIHERISEYIDIIFFDMNDYLNIYLYEMFWHEGIPRYICTTILIQTNIQIKNWIKNIQLVKDIRLD